MKKISSIGVKITIIVLIMVVSSMAFIGVFSYSLYRRDSIAVSADKARAIAESVAAAVDGGQFQEILTSGSKNQYWYDTKAYVDSVKTRTGVIYLYLLDKNYSETVRYFIEGSAPGEIAPIDLGEEESVDAHADEAFETLKTGMPTTTGIYDSEGFGMMVSGYAPIFYADGSVAGVVGADLSIDHVLKSSHFFGMTIIVCILIFSIIFWLVSRWFIMSIVGRPIAALSKASGMISKGDMDISLTVNSNDEIGVLTESFLEMAASTKKQIAVLESLAGGDLTAEIALRSERDSMGFALIKMINNLGAMFGEINSAAMQVKNGSGQISDGSQTLARGSSEQAVAVEQLTALLNQITQNTGESAELADNAARLSDTIRLNAEKGSRQMDEMIGAVGEINEASQSIGKVIKVIDDIAFQTNILALNAAVEAARAGQHGKGFAVVADEVRNLAAKSAVAAKDTGGLIANSMEKATLGSRIANETAASLAEIVSGIGESNRLVLEIAKSSDEQSETIAKINRGIDQVSQVVHQNSAAAEESAASSEEMSAQAAVLNDIVAKFKLKDAVRTSTSAERFAYSLSGSGKSGNR